jgi:lantibiotic transport system ATP-binding protein
MAPDSSLIIQTNRLSFAYSHKAVLNNIDLKVPYGSIFGFLGPNGSGKSTTIKVLMGLLQVPDGKVSVFGKELNRNKIVVLSKIGATMETPSLYDHLSAWRNLRVTQQLRQIPEERISEVLEIVGLSIDRNSLVRQFSTGMKQRLSLAIALLAKPELLILDEPINGLDPSGIIEIRNLLSKLNRERGCTIFLSSHILDEIEKICTHVAVIHKGRLLYQGLTSCMLNGNKSNDRLLIETDNNQKALAILTDSGAEIIGNQLLVTVDSRPMTSEIIRKLVLSGIAIYSVTNDRDALENSFLKIVEEGSENE